MITMDWVWLIICLAMLFIEVITAGNLVSIWFSIGALGALAVAYVSDNIALQLTVFLILSVSSLIVIRPFTKNLMRGNVVSTNADRMIGRRYIVSDTVYSDQWGSVMVNGEKWTATTADQTEIPAGSKVEVIAIEGVKLIVRAIEEE